MSKSYWLTPNRYSLSLPQNNVVNVAAMLKSSFGDDCIGFYSKEKVIDKSKVKKFK